VHGRGEGRFHHVYDRAIISSLIGALVALFFLAAGTASSDEFERVPPVTDAVVKKECGACHMAYQPQFLPTDAWRRMLDQLDQHFGADASLAVSVRQEILHYYLAHAGKQRLDGSAPLRITETPAWVRAHREVAAGAWTKPEVKFKGNCPACHKRAEAGDYEDD
jgi:Dihaem cytochrome c